MKKLFFVSGTGRSGTHLIGRTLSSHNEISGRIETPETFNLITKIASTQDFKPWWYTFIHKLILKNKLNKVLNSNDKNVLEKSHPSLWLVDFLIKKFDVKFIFVYRDLEPTVSSMLEHNGVLSWYKFLPLNKPNRFLGINSQNAKDFNSYTLEEKCALRWQSHYNEIFRLKQKYPNQIITIKYDEFLVNPQPILKDLSEFLNIDNDFEIEKFKTDSLDKWKTKLNVKQLEEIRKITSV